jgi:predicted NAD/FAD-binding protein
MAGVATAWLLEESFDVVLFEAREALGGNARTVEVDVRGLPVAVDLGAQYFHPGPYPTYVRLLERLGLWRRDDPGADGAHQVVSSITVLAPDELLPRFVSPHPPDRLWPLSESWNGPGVSAFLSVAAEGDRLEQPQGGWDVTVEEWLASLDLDVHQREQILLPWIASLYSGDLEQARAYSARSALVFLTRAIGGGAPQAVSYFTLAEGMGAVVERLAAEAARVTLHLAAPVDSIARERQRFRVASREIVEEVDLLVMATPAFVSADLLASIGGAERQRAALSGITFHDAELALHRDPLYAHLDSRYWSLVNAEVRGSSCEASMWLATALPHVDGAAVELWKSWIGRRDRLPSAPVASATFRHMLPTPESLAAQDLLLSRQGEGGIYFAGGATRPYDAQETALLSAIAVARALGVETPRLAALTEAEAPTV